MSSEPVYIHIPADLLTTCSDYRCPKTVNLGLGLCPFSDRRSSVPFTSPREVSCESHQARKDKRNVSRVGQPALWGHVKKVISVSERGMESGEEVSDGADRGEPMDFIDFVAQANTTSDAIDRDTFLPDLEIRVNPCHMHHRSQQHQPFQLQHQRPNARNDLLYSTSRHAGHHHHSNQQQPHSKYNRSTGSRHSASSCQEYDQHTQMEREKTFQRDVQAGKFQTYSRPTLPSEITSHDLVDSWLHHGSEPSGQGVSHFPKIIPSRNVNHTKKTVPSGNKSAKQHLNPIVASKTRNRGRHRNVNLSE